MNKAVKLHFNSLQIIIIITKIITFVNCKELQKNENYNYTLTRNLATAEIARNADVGAHSLCL